MKVTKVLFKFLLFFLTAVNSYSQTPCVSGMAGIYPCNNVDLKSRINLATLGAPGANDIWGWTDPLSGEEYAIIGLHNGTAFIDISNPISPIIVGTLASRSTTNNIWRDIKVVNNHAYIGSEINTHGIQIFDLTQLGSISSPPAVLSETGWINLGSSTNDSHNIVANDLLDHIFAVGTNNLCSGGITTYDASNPANPSFIGCNNLDGYSHDAQCFVYRGPDVAHIGKEICIGFNEDDVTIFDYSDPANPFVLSATTYGGVQYTHQGWVTDDHKYLLVDDELDENNLSTNTKTFVFDISDLNSPLLVYTYTHAFGAIDHNQYVRGPYVYQANYRAGMRILDISDLDNSAPSEVAFFDIYPNNDNVGFDGSWSVFPYYKSDCVAISGINGADEGGLFVVEPKLPHYVMAPIGLGVDTVCQGENAGFSFDMTQYAGFSNMDNLSLTGLPVGAIATFNNNPAPTNSQLNLTISNTLGVIPGNYSLTITGSQTPVNRVSIGLIVCAQPDKFDLISPANLDMDVSINPTLSWTASTNALDYTVEVSTSPSFATIDFSASGITTTSHTFMGLLPNENYYWRVIAKANHCEKISETFTFQTESIVVPVSWMSFELIKNNDSFIQLDWSTAFERNNSHFLVLRSQDGTNYEEIGIVNSSGDSDQRTWYSFVDHFAPKNWNYYKIKQLDFDGQVSFSPVKSIFLEAKIYNFKLSPNPNNGLEFIIKSNVVLTQPKIKIYNVLGQEMPIKFFYDQNSSSLIISPENQLPKGSYFVNIFENKELLEIKPLVII